MVAHMMYDRLENSYVLLLYHWPCHGKLHLLIYHTPISSIKQRVNDHFPTTVYKMIVNESSYPHHKQNHQQVNDNNKE
jgi:hypothetical protein